MRSGCSAQLAGGGKQGFLFIGPRMRDLVFPPTTLRLPILLERSWPSGNELPDSQRSQFEEDATLFTQQLDVQSLVTQAGSRP